VELILEIIRKFEGCYISPYICPAGVSTIGIGATFYEDGTRVTLRDPPITRERADSLLLWHVKNVYLPAVLKLCPSLMHETPGRVAAIVDFAFNLGNGALSRSTLRRKINAGDWDAVPAELRKWDKAAGVRLRGLTRRCEARVLLLSK
jgi:lysozyme